MGQTRKRLLDAEVVRLHQTCVRGLESHAKLCSFEVADAEKVLAWMETPNGELHIPVAPPGKAEAEREHTVSMSELHYLSEELSLAGRAEQVRTLVRSTDPQLAAWRLPV